jgi:hypothetical protein
MYWGFIDHAPIRTGRAKATVMASKASKKVNAQMIVRVLTCHEVKGSRSILLLIPEILSSASDTAIQLRLLSYNLTSGLI